VFENNLKYQKGNTKMSLNKIESIIISILLIISCVSCEMQKDSDSIGDTSKIKDRDEFAEMKVFDNSKVVDNEDMSISKIEISPVVAEIYLDSSYSGSIEDGSIKTPYKTFVKTLDAVSQKANRDMDGNIVVYLREGAYYLKNTLLFDKAVSGKNGYRVIFRNYNDEKVVIYGGTPIINWEKVENKPYYKASVETFYNLDTIYEDGILAVPARHPNIEDGKSAYNRVFKTAELNNLSNFIFFAGDFPDMRNIEKLQCNVWPGGLSGDISWFEDLIDVEKIDYEKNILTLSKPARHILGKGTRYFLQNTIEFLDTPGEFFHDIDLDEIYYYPIKGNPNESTIIAPIGGHVFHFTQSGENFAENIVLEGLEFRVSNREMDAIRISGSENITILNCTLDGVGGNGIYIEDFARNIEIYNNKICNTGSSGVYLNGSENVRIINNHIFESGKIIGHMAGISINMGYNTTVSNNMIHDIRRSGIDIRGNGNDGTIISYNDIHSCTTDSQDIAPIYAYDTGEDITISNNRIHDSTIPFSFGAGLYLDDKSRGFIVTNNILHNLQTEESDGNLNTLIVAKGWNNKIYNNILVDNNLKRGGEAFSTWPMNNFTNNEISIYQNIFHHDKPEISFIINSMGTWNEDRYELVDRNLYYTKEGKYLFKFDSGNLDFEAWKNFNERNFDLNTITEDPLFIDRKNGDYRLMHNSPAYICGFEDINIQDIGLRSDFLFGVNDEEIDRIFVREKGKNVNSGTIYLKEDEIISIEFMARTKSGFVANIGDAIIEGVVSDKQVALISSEGSIKGINRGITEVAFSITKNKVQKITNLYVIVDGRE